MSWIVKASPDIRTEEDEPFPVGAKVMFASHPNWDTVGIVLEREFPDPWPGHPRVRWGTTNGFVGHYDPDILKVVP